MITATPDCDLSGITTFHIPARCRGLVTYTDPWTDLPVLRDRGIFADRWMHMGEGSNLLFAAPFDGNVLCSHTDDLSFDRMIMPDSDDVLVKIKAPSGLTMDKLCRMAADRGLWGIENLSGIPGNVGGAAVQNIGAYGVELKDVALEVEVYDITDGRFKRINASECDYGYRRSMFKDPSNSCRYIVVAVTMALWRTPRPRLGYGALAECVERHRGESDLTPAIVREAVIAMRDSKLPDPARVGSAGSFFKNPVVDAYVYERVVEKAREMWGDDVTVPHYDLPDGQVKIPAAWFIDRLGWKGRRVGGAAVWEKQPLVLVNFDGTATASDVVSLMEGIIKDVDSHFGIILSPEVILVNS